MARAKKTVVKEAVAVTVTETGLEAAGVGTVAGAEAALELFHPVTADWFKAVFEGPTAPQIEGWPAIARGESTLILAPTGTGKNVDRVSLVSEQANAGAGAGDGMQGALSFAAEGAGGGR